METKSILEKTCNSRLEHATEKTKSVHLHCSLTSQPCPGAGLGEPGYRQHFCLCGSSERSAGGFSGSLKHPTEFHPKTHKWRCNFNEYGIQHWPLCKTTISGNQQTLCCSTALWNVGAVTACACWMTNSSLRAPSASCSQEPTASRGAGRERSRWRCQSRNCNKKYGIFSIKESLIVNSCLFYLRLSYLQSIWFG